MTIEYKDSKRITMLSTSSESLLTSSDYTSSNFTTVGSTVAITSNSVVFSSTPTNSDNGQYEQITALAESDSYTLDFKLNVSSHATFDNYYLALTNTSGAINSANQLGLQTQGGSYNRFTFSTRISGSSSETASSNGTVSTGTNYYCTLSSDGTTATFKAWTNSGRTGTAHVTLTRTISGLGTLNYIQHRSRNSGDSNTWSGTVSEVALSKTLDKPTNVQDNSILVEKDTARRYWFSEALAPTVSDDFSSTSGWTQNDSAKIGLDTSNDKLDFNIVITTNDNAYRAIPTGSTTWVMRYLLRFSTISTSSGSNIYFLTDISDDGTTEGNNSATGSIGLYMNADESSNNSLDLYGAGATSDEIFVPVVNTDYYVEVIKTSATTATATIGTDSYGGTAGGGSGSITGLTASTAQDTFAVRNRGTSSGSSGHSIIGYIKDFKYYNGVTSATPATWTLQLSLADLKAYWKMGEASGNLVNHATSIGSKSAMSADLVSSGTVNRGTAGHVSGVDSIGFPTYDADGNKVTANNSASDYGFMNKAGAKFTACWWAKNESHNSTVDLWGLGGNGNGADISFRNKSSGFTIWFSGTEYTSFTHSVGDNNWHFYMLSWDEDGGSDNAQFQLDGTKQTATITTSNTSDSTSTLTIGDVSGNEPEMDIQEFSLWNRVLTDTEIAHIYNAGVGRQL